MTDEYPQPVVLDATVLSNFASTDGVSLLATVLELPVVVPTVRDELERGLDAGHEYLDTVVAALERQAIALVNHLHIRGEAT